MILSTPEWSDAATITASSAVSTMPVTYLQTMQPGEKWRTSSSLTPYLVIDLTTARAIDTIALLYGNVTAAATWRIRAAASEAGLTAAPAYDNGAIAMRTADSGRGVRQDRSFYHALLHLDAAQTYRYWRIDIDDSTNTAGYLEFGRLYMDEAWQPENDISIEWSPPSWIDPSLVAKTGETQTIPLNRTPYRATNFTLDFLSQAQMFGNAVPIDRMRGSKKDVLFCADPTEATYLQDITLYGLIRESGRVSNAAFNLYSKTYGIEELNP